MQKVTKEVGELLKAGDYTLYDGRNYKGSTDLDSLEYLEYLLGEKEARAFSALQKTMTSQKNQGKSVFDIWMMEESFLVQECGMAYVERMVLDQFIKRIDTAEESLQKTLRKVCLLFALHIIQRDMGWYVCHKVLKPRKGLEVDKVIQQLCGNGTDGLGDDVLSLVDAFGIPEYVMAAPIASDWVEYNERDNQGEVV